MSDKADGGRERPDTLDVRTGAEAILGLLSEDPDGDSPEDEQPSGEEPQSEDLEDDLVEDDDEDFEDDEDELQDDVDEDEDSEASEQPETYTVKVDGQEVEVTLEELRSGYSRTEVWTKRMQDLADERRTLVEEAQELASAQDAYQQRLQLVENALRQTIPEDVDLARLKKEDPEAYVELRERADQIQAIQAEQQRVMQERQEAAATEREKLLAIERERLEAAIPEWTDESVATTEKQKMLEVAQTDYGFTQEEVGQVIDHRAILLLRDAMRYRELANQQDSTTRKRKSKKSSTLKPGSSKSGTKRGSKSRAKKIRAQRKRLRETGSVDDAAGLFLEALKSD